MPRDARPEARTPQGFRASEIRAFAAIFCALAAIEIAAPFIHVPPQPGSGAPDGLFGVSQLRWWSLPLAGTVAGLMAGIPRLPDAAKRALGSPLATMAISIGCGVIFYALRSWFINPDGALFPMKFMVDVPSKGFHATHDEMWELYVHSKFWVYTNAHFGWNVNLSYQVLSCAAGAAFVFLLLIYVKKFLSGCWPQAFLACISGGYMQLFFGDVENYTIMTTLVMAYFLTSARSFADRRSILVPSLLLAVALTFHLEAGFLLPSLMYLLIVTWRRGARGEVVAALAASALVVAGTLFFFDTHGLPIGDLFSHSQALGQGGHFGEMLVRPDVEYHFQIVNLAFLLVPAWVLVPVLLAHRRIAFDPINVHLIVAAVVMSGFVLVWKAQLGVYNDWNLFAMAAVPISLLAWRNIFGVAAREPAPWSLVALIALFFAHSYSWVIGNHLL